MNEDIYMDYENTTHITDTFIARDELSVTVVTYSIIGIMAAIENAFALLIFSSSKRFRKKRNVFLFSLSLADFIVGVLSCLVYFEKVYNSPSFGAILEAMFLVSVFSICAVSVERYIAIVAAPFTYKNIITFKRCIIVCFFYWILTMSATVALYAIVYNEWTRFAMCVLTMVILIANYIMYFKISKALTSNDRTVTANLGQNVIGRSKKLIRSFIILLVVSTLCWAPLCCFLVIALFSENVNENKSVLNIMYCICLSNSFINPFIYWYSLPGAKEGVFDLICCFKKNEDKKEHNKKQVPSQPTTSNTTV
ncbi:tachykinin-like peptides receptor 86C [Antedon mediterranea]|uniref:tachykinin-like peptides receptor 86C n=1 Tax=Antedon mediterranea TaxID=105859 RepID=UPI003AF52BF4